MKQTKGDLRILRSRDTFGRGGKAGVSVATGYRMIKAGTFPKPVLLSPKTVGWLEHEVDEWIAERQRIRDKEHSHPTERPASISR